MTAPRPPTSDFNFVLPSSSSVSGPGQSQPVVSAGIETPADHTNQAEDESASTSEDEDGVTSSEDEEEDEDPDEEECEDEEEEEEERASSSENVDEATSSAFRLPSSSIFTFTTPVSPSTSVPAQSGRSAGTRAVSEDGTSSAAEGSPTNAESSAPAGGRPVVLSGDFTFTFPRTGNAAPSASIIASSSAGAAPSIAVSVADSTAPLGTNIEARVAVEATSTPETSVTANETLATIRQLSAFSPKPISAIIRCLQFAALRLEVMKIKVTEAEEMDRSCELHRCMKGQENILTRLSELFNEAEDSEGDAASGEASSKSRQELLSALSRESTRAWEIAPSGALSERIKRHLEAVHAVIADIEEDEGRGEDEASQSNDDPWAESSRSALERSAAAESSASSSALIVAVQVLQPPPDSPEQESEPRPKAEADDTTAVETSAPSSSSLILIPEIHVQQASPDLPQLEFESQPEAEQTLAILPATAASPPPTEPIPPLLLIEAPPVTSDPESDPESEEDPETPTLPTPKTPRITVTTLDDISPVSASSTISPDGHSLAILSSTPSSSTNNHETTPPSSPPSSPLLPASTPSTPTPALKHKNKGKGKAEPRAHRARHTRSASATNANSQPYDPATDILFQDLFAQFLITLSESPQGRIEGQHVSIRADTILEDFRRRMASQHGDAEMEDESEDGVDFKEETDDEVVESVHENGEAQDENGETSGFGVIRVSGLKSGPRRERMEGKPGDSEDVDRGFEMELRMGSSLRSLVSTSGSGSASRVRRSC